MSPEILKFADRSLAGEALAKKIADDLRQALQKTGNAAIAVSGGSTPAPFFDALREEALEWDKVVVTLVDERWVPEDADRSNARLVKSHLLQAGATSAQFVPLFGGEPNPKEGIASATVRLNEACPNLDVVVLGMGADAHTASFFPGAIGLDQAIDITTKARLVAVHADAAGEPRVTLTLPEIVSAEHLYLHITGREKLEVLEAASGRDVDPHDMPIRAVINHRSPIVFYSD